MKLLQILFVGIVFMTMSCNKKTGNVNPFIGTWTVKLETITYDPQGSVLSTATIDDGSTIEISKDELDINAHPVKVSATFSSFEPVGYVLATGNGGVFFSPDLHNDRINFWYYGWTSAVSKTATIISRGSNSLILGAVTLFAGSTTASNSMQTIQTLTLTKK